MTEVREVVRYERVPLDPALLQRHCRETLLADVVTYADLEAKVSSLFLCVRAHNLDKDRIESLQ